MDKRMAACQFLWKFIFFFHPRGFRDRKKCPDPQRGLRGLLRALFDWAAEYCVPKKRRERDLYDGCFFLFTFQVPRALYMGGESVLTIPLELTTVRHCCQKSRV